MFLATMTISSASKYFLMFFLIFVFTVNINHTTNIFGGTTGKTDLQKSSITQRQQCYDRHGRAAVGWHATSLWALWKIPRKSLTFPKHPWRKLEKTKLVTGQMLWSLPNQGAAVFFLLERRLHSAAPSALCQKSGIQHHKKITQENENLMFPCFLEGQRGRKTFRCLQSSERNKIFLKGSLEVPPLIDVLKHLSHSTFFFVLIVLLSLYALCTIQVLFNKSLNYRTWLILPSRLVLLVFARQSTLDDFYSRSFQPWQPWFGLLAFPHTFGLTECLYIFLQLH